MPTYIYGHDPNNPDKPRPNYSSESAQAVVEKIVADMDKPFRPKIERQAILRAGIMEEKPDGTRREFVLQTEFPLDSQVVEDLCKAVLVVGGAYCLVRLLSGR